MHAPSDLGGEGFEAPEPESTRGAVLRVRERRRDRQVVSSMQRNGLIDDPQIALQLFELTAHPVEPARQRRVIACVRAEELIERRLHDRRLGLARTLGRSFQPLDKLLGQLHRDLSFHRGASWDLNCTVDLPSVSLTTPFSLSIDTSRRRLCPFASRRPSVSRKNSKRSRPFACAAACALSGSGGVTVSQNLMNSAIASTAIERSRSSRSPCRVKRSSRRTSAASRRSESSGVRNELMAASAITDFGRFFWPASSINSAMTSGSR